MNEALRAAIHEAQTLETSGGGGDSTGMEPRVTRLEEWAKLSGERMSRIETKIDALPSKTDMLTMFIATFAVLGLILAGLAWLDGRAGRYSTAIAARQASPAPVVIQVPAYPPPRSR